MSKTLEELAVITYGKDYKNNPKGDASIPIIGTGGLMGYTTIPLNTGEAVLTGRKGSINNPIYIEGEFWNVDTIFCIKTKQGVNTKWLYYNLCNTDLSKLNEATGVPSVNTASLYRLEFQYFDTDTQTKIAHILTTIDKVIEKTEAAIAKYEAIKQGMMHDLFTRGIGADGQLRPSYADAPELYKESALGWIPKEWEVREFSEFIGKVDSGWSPVCEVQPAKAGEWGSLKTTSISWEGYNPNENKRLPKDLSPKSELEVKYGDILITRVGPRNRVGVVVHVNDSRSRLMVSDNMFRIKISKNEELYLPFLEYLLGSYPIQSVWKRRIAGLAEAQVVINQKVLNQTFIMIPEMSEQKKIVKIISNVIKKIKVEKQVLSKQTQLKQGLMQDLLTGKVPVKAELINA